MDDVRIGGAKAYGLPSSPMDDEVRRYRRCSWSPNGTVRTVPSGPSWRTSIMESGSMSTALMRSVSS